MRSRRLHLRDLTYVHELRICNVRLTNGLRRIFALLATLAGLVLSASALGRCMSVVAVPYDEMLSAFEFVSSAPPAEHNAYVSMDTGQIHWVSELASMDEEIPEDLDTSDRYISVPHKNDLDLGRKLVLRFAAQEMPQAYDRVRAIFQRKGAYSRFKDFLQSEGQLEKWYKFEAEAHDKALREWCADNGIQILEKSSPSAA